MDFVKKRDLISDKYFRSRGAIYLDLPIGRSTSATPRIGTIKIAPKEIYDGDFRVPTLVEKALNSISQLGLKELWVGGTAMQHNRWYHSRGVFNVGAIWLSALRQTKRVPRLATCFPSPLDSWPRVKDVVGSALLLHDFGHLPFSHLLDEVLKWIHWVPDSYEVWGSEAAVLRSRLSQIREGWKTERNVVGTKDGGLSWDDLGYIIELLVLGNYGVPWLQAIINSPIDADKIDYIRFDSNFLKDCDFGISQRLHLDNPHQWMTDFLSEQEVNHGGYLCLHGRSAMAAVDLWRERIFLYNRFYLAPELRVPERMAFEIVQQFLIRSTMSSLFAKRSLSLQTGRYPELYDIGSSLGDSITPKYNTACSIMQEWQDASEQPELEFATLREMHGALHCCEGIDSGYRDFLSVCFANLAALAGQEGKPRQLREVVDNCLVQCPLVFDCRSFEKVREILRPVQHTYCREALVDLVRMPKVLAGPRMSGMWQTGRAAFECPIVVPAGAVESWGIGDKATCLLGEECVRNLEIPICRAIVISPDGNKSRRARYIWERVRASLLDEGIDIQVAES